MKVIFDKVKLLNVLTPAMGCVSSKSTFTALEGVLIEASADGRCEIGAYDLEKGIRSVLRVKVEEPGSYVLNAQDFYQYVRVMPENEIELEVSDKMVARLRCGRVCYTMRALSGKEFPAPPDLEGEWGFVLEQSVFKSITAHTFHSIALGDSTHPELCGGYLEIDNDRLSMVACDSFTLSKCEYHAKMKEELPGNLSMIIPGKSLAELMKMLSDEEDELMTVKPAKKHIVFVIGDLIFFTRLIDMKYIDYGRVIQDDLPIRVKIGRSSFMECLERAALVSEKRSANAAKSCLRLKFEENTLKISSTSLSGQISDELVCEKEGADLEIGFSCRYLLDILRAVDGEDVILSLRGPRNAMIVRPAEEEDGKEQLYMVLPVKLTD